MKRNDAIALLLLRDLKMLNVLNKLTKWDGNKTLQENAKGINRSVILAYQFAHRFSLPFKKLKRGAPSITTKNSVKLLVKKGLTISQIARLCGVSRQRIEQIYKNKE